MEFHLGKQNRILAGLAIAAVLAGIFCLFSGSSGMSAGEGLRALFGEGTAANIRIMRRIRLPRVFAAILAGAGLSAAGLIMQTCLNNPMASPSTLGVTNAAVFGANLSIIVFSGGCFSAGNHLETMFSAVDPKLTGTMAFAVSFFSVLLILGLCRRRAFTPGAVVLSGIAIGYIWSAATTLLQYFATDTGLSAAVIWSFGDLGRADYETDALLLVILIPVLLYFRWKAWSYNALLSGVSTAQTLGVDVKRLRFVSLLLASLLTAVCVSGFGIIGFVGIICPHVIKRLLGQDHRVTVWGSALAGSLLLLLADTLARGIGSGTALPAGAVTSLLGAPFFLFLTLHRRS